MFDKFEAKNKYAKQNSLREKKKYKPITRNKEVNINNDKEDEIDN